MLSAGLAMRPGRLATVEAIVLLDTDRPPSNCINCGAAVPDGAKFCHSCGLSFTQEIAAVRPAEMTPLGARAVPADPVAATAMQRIQDALKDRYTVQGELGRGGMATVYLATDVKHEREVAIKVLLPELSESIGGERFEREIRLAAKLQHPHILGLFDSGIADGLLYYVMPFVKGESLRGRLEREGMLPVDDAIGITLEVADALGYAHELGIVHRDIKPENILLQGGHALVADFGIARAVSDAGAAKLTQTGMAVGTPIYMAPEQSMGDVVGPSADLYSLGCVLYEMLAGEPPFTGKNAAQIMAKHVMEQVPSICIVRSVVPEEIEQAIFAVLSKAPVDRPQSAAQFATLMGMPFGATGTMRVSRGSTATRRVPSGAQPLLPPQVVRPLWRQPRAIGGVAAALIVVAGLFAFLSSRNKVAATAGPEARRLAVLYFKDVSKDGSLGPLADGLTEGLIRAMSDASTLTVISQAGVGKYRSGSVPLDSVARALRVGYLVRGEVEPDGVNIVVHLRLDDASGVNLRRASIQRPAGNLTAMRDTLALVASDLIRQQLKEEIQVRQQRSTTSSTAAWLLVQRGELERKNADAGVAKGDSATTERAFHAADSLFATAEAADGAWADPIVARATLAYRRSRAAGRDLALVRKWVDVGLGHADRALAKDGENADALEVRGNLKYFTWLTIVPTDPAAARALLLSAKADLEHATKANHNQAGAYASLSHLYQNDNAATRTDVSIAGQRALEADEFLANAEVILGRLFLANYDDGQFEKAGQWCAEARRRFPSGKLAVRCQLFLLTGKGKEPDVAAAWHLADSVLAVTPPAARAVERLNADLLVAAVIGRAGRAKPALLDSARHVARRSEGDATIDPTRQLSLLGAFAYATIGDTADAVRQLKQYLAANPQRVQAYADDPGWWFREIAQDPRFRQVVGAAK